MQNNGDKKDKAPFWSSLPETIKAIAAIITAIGGLAGLILALDGLGALDRFKPAPTPAPTLAPTPTPVPEFGWGVYFEESVKTSAWRPGNNYYDLIADCPDIGDIRASSSRIEFSVDENAQLFPDNIVELHYFGISMPNSGNAKLLSSINPNQRTKFVVGWINMTLEQAKRAATECHVKAVIDDTWTVQLSPTDPKPE